MIFKSIPFWSTLIIIIFLNLTNQKDNTKIRILIWDTPSISLGNYLALSTGTGFILSYIITTNISKIRESKINNKFKYKSSESNEKPINYSDLIEEQPYENTLIERDIKDPSPTINANYRVIGKINKNTTSFNSNNKEVYNSSDYINESNDLYYEEETNYKYDNPNKLEIEDWNDNAYESW